MPEPHAHKRKRIMREFVINEISMVDRPSMEGALAVIIKRDSSHEEHDKMQLRKVTSPEPRPRSFDDFESAMRYLAAEHGMSKIAAMEKISSTRPDLIAKYNREGEAIAKAESDRVVQLSAPSPERVRWDAAVKAIMSRDRIDRVRAMELARVEHADLYRAFQAA